jgi:hypothetical protein
MSKVSGKIRLMDRRQTTMEELLKSVAEKQDLHGRHLLLIRFQQRQITQYMRHLHDHLMGSKKRHGVFARLRTLEIRQKAILTVSSVIITAVIAGLLKAIF